MRVITFNANGIRAAHRKGFFNWLRQQDADLICIQETKAHADQLYSEDFFPRGYYCYYRDAEKKGYSGVAIYSRAKPKRVTIATGIDNFDTEGRYLELALENLNLISLYLPSGTSGSERQAFKFKVLDDIKSHLEQLLTRPKPCLICGDFNIAHQEIDLKNWRSNQKNPGFLPEERAWLDNLFTSTKWFDAFRQLNQEDGQFTWWSARGQARANNVGWRIDYQIGSRALRHTPRSAEIYKDDIFSDHAPLLIDYDFNPF